MSKLVSVIIPVYDVEKQITRCLDSVCEQTYKNIEIILVDDGSNDKSGLICDEYAEIDNRIIVIHKNNQGANSARKVGIEKANGEYITFIDADDYVDKDYVLNLIENIGDSDICTSACNWIDITGNNHIEKDNFPIGKYETEEQLSQIFRHMIFNMGCPYDYYRGMLTYMVCKLYRKSIVLSVFNQIDEKLEFCEDALFVFSYLLKSKKISITDKALYNYCHREDSITHRKINHYLESLERLFNSFTSQINGHIYEEELRIQIEEYVNYRLKQAPHYMCFKEVSTRPTYGFPFAGRYKGKRGILYGAGKVGKDYYREIIAMHELELVAWVDVQYDKIHYPSVPSISSPQTIKNLEYDVLIVAVGEKKHKEIEDSLIKDGISKDKIIWEKPIICRYYD